MLKTCCIHSGVPPDQGLAGCTPHRQGLPPCHSLRRECFSMRSHNFPTPLSTSALQYLQAQKIEGACWYYCTPKLSLLPGISYIAKPDTTKKCHNLICTFKGKKKKIKHPNPYISAALALVCISVTLPCTSSL